MNIKANSELFLSIDGDVVNDFLLGDFNPEIHLTEKSAKESATDDGYIVKVQVLSISKVTEEVKKKLSSVESIEKDYESRFEDEDEDDIF